MRDKPQRGIHTKKGYGDGDPISETKTGLSVYVKQIRNSMNREWLIPRSSLKGGDPAAGSPTATLLRLHPSR